MCTFHPILNLIFLIRGVLLSSLSTFFSHLYRFFVYASVLICFTSWGVPESNSEEASENESRPPLGKVISELNRLVVGAKIVDAYQTDIPGVVEFHLEDGDLFFATEDGRFLFTGPVFQRIGTDTLVNLTESRRSQRFFRLVDPNSAIQFKPHAETKTVAYVFTDFTCGYCRALHKNIENYLEKGIEIRYLAYPRNGKQTSVYGDMVSIWCSDDPQRALTRAKRGKQIETEFCAHPVDDHLKLGTLMGVRGTPTIVMDDGRVFPGFVRAEKLLPEVD